MLLHTGATIKSHTISNGIVTFDDGTGSQSLINTGDVAAATQYLAANDWGKDGATVAFTATISGVTDTYVYTQTTKDSGIANGAMVDLINVSATSIVVNGTTLSVLEEAAPNPPSITSIPENSGGGINASEASDGTPVVVGLSGTGAISNDTLTINWGSQTVTRSLTAGDILAGSATVTVLQATISAQGDGTFDVTANLTNAASIVSANSPPVSVTVDTVAPAAPTITLDPGEQRRRHQRHRGLGRHAGGGGPDGQRGGGGRHADHQLGRPDGQPHAAGGRDLGQQRHGDGAAGDDRGAGRGHVQRDGGADRRSGQPRPELDGVLGHGRHVGADGGGCDHGDRPRQRHVVERLRHQ